jgi:putative transposase
MYFNEENERSGSLFQGRFKAKHVEDNDYLLHLSAYINLNDRVHALPLRGSTSQWESWSSWSEYVGGELGPAQKIFGKICEPSIILDQFDYSDGAYQKFAESSLITSREAKLDEKERKALWFE